MKLFLSICISVVLLGCNPIAEEVSPKANVIITAYYEAPDSYYMKDTIKYESAYFSGEYIEFDIYGHIYDVQIVELDWDEEKKQLIEKSIIKHIGNIEDQKLVLNTYEPEGMPIERVKWKYSNGEADMHTISYDGRDD